MRYRASLPPSPWRLPFAIMAQGGLYGGKRHGKRIRRIAYRGVERLDLKFEAAAALLVRDQAQARSAPARSGSGYCRRD